jgi:outer membrane receptor protein involved in Fe transport
MTLSARSRRISGQITLIGAILACALAPRTGTTQGSATIRGHVTDIASGRPLSGVNISIGGSQAVVSNDFGAYVIAGVSAGTHTITFRRIGFQPRDTSVVVVGGVDMRCEFSLKEVAIALGRVTVTAVSRQPERIVDAPAAISAVDPGYARDMSATGQAPLLVANLPGVHAMQSGVYDFNLNARGFNATLSRNVLVLVDGRDVSVPLLGNQDWADLAMLGDGVRVEMVRGPGSALYGANALSGVLAINSPAVRVSHGSQLSVTTGGLSTARMNGTLGGLTNSARFGYRVSGGYVQSGTWDLSRTNTGYLEREYADAGINTDSIRTPVPGFELTPLHGQGKAGAFGTPGAATGDADAVRTWFASARADFYPRDGSVVTLEGGDSRIENPVITTGAGRSQVLRAQRPWGRLAWTSDAFSLMTYYSGRDGRSISLGTGTLGLDHDGMWHTEAQFNRRFAAERGRVVLGGSLRTVSVDTKGTVLAQTDDGRTDKFYSAFGQVDYAVTPKVKFVAASRVDKSTLDDAQFSPKLAVLFKPRADQALRVTLNRGFRAPSQFERFLYFPAGPPIDLSLLEGGLRASPLGPALAGVPDGALFTQSNAVPLLALGNEKLRPQRVTSLELGYKGETRGWFITLDAYYSRINDFTSGILTGVNADYGPWTAPDAVPAEARAGLEGAVNGAVPGLSRLPGGATAYVLSYGNEGRATEWGAELGFGAELTSSLRAEGGYSAYRSRLEQSTLFPADTVSPNTPATTANVGLLYHRPDGLRVRAGIRVTSSFFFRDFLWAGTVPASRAVDVTASRPIGTSLWIGVTGTNVLDERRFQLYGGSVIGRRLLLTLTWKP